MKMKKETLSIKEFEANAPSHLVIKILYQDEWLFVDDYHSEKNWVVIKSNGLDYRAEGNITISYFVEESE